MTCFHAWLKTLRAGVLSGLTGAVIGAGGASAAELQVLSAGAIEPGLASAVTAFQRETGHVVRVTFNTAPELRKRMLGQPAFDVVIAPPAVMPQPLFQRPSVAPPFRRLAGEWQRRRAQWLAQWHPRRR